MTTLQYEDSGCRKKQIEKERDEFAIGFAEYLLIIYNEDIIYDA